MATIGIPCLCPRAADGSLRHPDGDQVEMRDRLGFRAVASIRWAIALLYDEDPEAGTSEALGLLTEQYLIHGICGWSLTDDRGGPLAVTKAAIRKLLLVDGREDVAITLGDAADAIYQGQVLVPLLVRASTSSPDMPTDESTSPSPVGSAERPTPLRPSSTSTSPTDATGTTSASPNGGSSSSPSSGSAA